jgi:signal transduction histidine kinase
MKTTLLEAEQSSKAKSQFLSTMSHEIRTPLNAVIGLSGLLSDSSLTPQQKEFSMTIKKSGENLLRIINNILDFSKIESGKLELEENEINLRESIEHVLELVAGINTNPNLEVLYEVEDNVPAYVTGDAVRLQQILTNLISNSLKFTNDGEILIHLTLKREFSSSIVLQYEISDTGIGIPKDKLNRLFQRFSQVDDSSTRKFGGTGLGLVISKRLVEAMGGNITVSSIENIGSTFTFTTLFKKVIKEAEIETRPVLKNKKVFLLADNSRILNILQKRLVLANLHVTSFNSSTNLISHINDLESYDFGIIDMQMPEINGIEVA